MSMTLRQLVEFRERLKVDLDTSGIEFEVKRLCENLSYLDKDLNTECADFLQNSIDHYTALIDQAHKNNANLAVILKKLESDILSVSRKFFTDNYDLEYNLDQNTDVRRGRKLHAPQQVMEMVEQRISQHVDWKYPGMQIGLQDDEWSSKLVACDPLYLVEPNVALISDLMEQFTPEYQRRLRPYYIRDNSLKALPQNQFNFVFCWNYLNYKSLDTIKQWLSEVYKVLRPGGVFMFTYNNADTPGGAGFAETRWMSYMPKSILVPLCESLGYTVIASYDFDASVNWLEVAKPGELKTVKAHQALGEIKAIN